MIEMIETREFKQAKMIEMIERPLGLNHSIMPSSTRTVRSLEEAEALLPGITTLAKALRARFGQGVTLRVTAERMDTINENHSHLEKP